MNKIEKKILLSFVLIFSIFINKAFAEKEDNGKIEVEKEPLFQNIEDRTFKLNQANSDRQLYSPFNSPFSQAQFVPDIALILDFSYAQRNLSNENFSSLITPAFSRSSIKSHGPLNGKNGFNFNYGELVIASTVDPFFDLFTTFHLNEFEFEIEEAFFNTRNIPWGFQFKAGKFLSSFGRINSQHTHFWDFADQNLIYDNLLGSHGILEKGVQVNWIAPLDTYLLLGAEVLGGDNPKSFGTSGFQVGTNKLEEVNIPNLLVAFMKSSMDFEDLTALGGLSFAQGGTRYISESSSSNTNMHIHSISENNQIPDNFAGGTRLYGADLTLKYFFDSYRYISLQTEYLHRSISGNAYTTASERKAYSSEQSGLYTQLIWKFNQQWRFGGRYDLMNQNNIFNNNIRLDNIGNLSRYSAMIDYNPSEFSRIRLQYNYDQSKYLDSNQQPLNEVFLQFNMAIGAHGAHQF